MAVGRKAREHWGRAPGRSLAWALLSLPLGVTWVQITWSPGPREAGLGSLWGPPPARGLPFLTCEVGSKEHLRRERVALLWLCPSQGAPQPEHPLCPVGPVRFALSSGLGLLLRGL